jgi:hypothetical protein
VRQVSLDLGTPCLDFWHLPDLLDTSNCHKPGRRFDHGAHL